MIKVKAVQTFRDKNNTIIGYSLADSKGNVKKLKSQELKKAIKAGKIEVINLTLTSDNRLVSTKSKMSVNANKKKQVVSVRNKVPDVRNAKRADKVKINVKKKKSPYEELLAEINASEAGSIFDIVIKGDDILLQGIKVDKDRLKGKISIPKGVTVIGERVFMGCKNITEVYLQDSVNTIKTECFKDCESLINIYLNSVKEIGGSCFANCKSLTSIIIPYSVKRINNDYTSDGCFGRCTSLKSVIIENPNLYLDISTFQGCKALISVDFPDGFHDEDGLASTFAGCTSLKSIDIPDGVNMVNGMFYGCTSLQSIKIPKATTDLCPDIGHFEGCTSLKRVVLHDEVTALGNCFNGCTSLMYINIPNSVKDISDNCFDDCHDIVTVVCNHGSYAEVYCKNHNIKYLKYDTLINDEMFNIVEEDGEIVLIGVKNQSDLLKEIKIPDGVTALDDNCFNGNMCLESVKIPNSVRVIGAECFRGCKSLKSIVIPESVERIGYRNRDEECPVEDGCFSGCTSLASVKICNPSISINDYDTFYGCTSLKNVEFHKDYTGSLDGTFDGCTSLEHIDLPDGVLINPYAFYKCSALKSIKVPRGTDCLGDYAFGGCVSLESIILPDTCIECDGECFSGCKSLKSIYIPDSVTFIGGLEDSPNVVVTCNPNSYAEKYCKENNIKYKYR